MALSSEQEAFRKIFADNLRQKITADGIFVEPDIEHDISEKFIHALVEFKEELRADFRTHQKTRGEMSWSIEREKCIADFAAKLNTIFAPIGGIKPQAASAFWSGKGVVRAAEFGTDFANTIPGFVINQVHGALHETFTKKAYTHDDLLDTATNVGMWEAMSKLYAEGTIDDAHIFLIDGETSQQSVLWSTELNTLRQRQATGEVSEIWVHTLTNEALLDYHALANQKKNIDPTDTKALESVDKKINALLKHESCWTKSQLDNSTALKLKISGFSDPHHTVNYQTIKSATNKWKQFSAKMKESEESSDVPVVEKHEKPLSKIDELIADGSNPRLALMQLKMLKHQVQADLSGKDEQSAEASSLQALNNDITSRILSVRSTPMISEAADSELTTNHKNTP